MTSEVVNVAARLTLCAQQRPDDLAVIMPGGRRSDGKAKYKTISFADLDRDSSTIASGLLSHGLRPGMRVVLMVPPCIDFITLVFATFKAGLVTVLIDPGMGRWNLIQCLEESRPEAFIGIPLAHAVRCLFSRRFPLLKHLVTVGRRWFWGGATLDDIRRKAAADFAIAPTQASDAAAIIFTTGSTGPPKGVLYRHGNFDRQATEIRDFYGIEPGGVDLSGFPLFALFNAAMGMTTLIPEMDATKPALVDPRKIIEAVRDWKVNQAFGSPALWNRVGRYCETSGEKLPTLRRVLSAGAPVPVHVLQRLKKVIHPEGDIHTPYGATEALPVASIAASEVLRETGALSAEGKGTCVGRKFPGIEWKVIAISDGPIDSIEQATMLADGEIGELIVRGPVVTSEYVTRTDCNPLHKVRDGNSFWHRMGDVGYLAEDPQHAGEKRFWFCGRKSHRVLTPDGTLYTIPCEAIFNQHARIYRSALVGIGKPGEQRPVMIVEPWPEQFPTSSKDKRQLIEELKSLGQTYDHTRAISDILVMRAMPVDIRHNAKIFREKLAPWAAKQLGIRT
ncbi:AMP-dependent synthetase and ligase [Pirellula staleyi DSM 6068]|uniref:AMP-dependent synthetase and ligase n=1 Tax=Pirellula staleyi (strain ATCC 27377 / DSM 6068 / ICPB 4128) TaxID=530564 RepID=D2QWP7_PIRSD|nr:fatty acid CoA ligase family protein [Pirellula staleyi]ADB17850.1 AMP-dependent synthetase and ligase [Pirellula staleyi DSM 6068]